MYFKTNPILQLMQNAKLIQLNTNVEEFLIIFLDFCHEKLYSIFFTPFLI